MISSEFLWLLVQNKVHISKKQDSYFTKIGLGFIGVLIVFAFAPSFLYDIWNSIFSSPINFAKQPNNYDAFQKGAFRTVFLLSGLFLGFRHFIIQKRNINYFTLLIIIVCVIDLGWVSRSNFIKELDLNRLYQKAPFVSKLQRDTSEFRVMSLPRSLPNRYLNSHEIEDISGFYDNEYNLFRTYRKDVGNSNLLQSLSQDSTGLSGNILLDMLNVKYVIGRQKNGEIALVKNSNYLPRVYVSYDWNFLPQENILNAIQTEHFNPRKTTWVANRFKKQLPKAGIVSNPFPATITKVFRNSDEREYQITLSHNGLVIFSDFFFPHWQAKVNEKETPILQVNHLFQGIYLKAGTHTVKISYHSPWIKKGLWVSLFSAFLLTVFLLFFKKITIRPNPSKS